MADDAAMPAASRLTPAERAFLVAARSATLATLDDAGLPRLVPICFALASRDDDAGRPRLYTPIDEKPKRSSDPRQLARVRDIERRPNVTVLVDRWDEDWTRLAWLRAVGLARLLDPVEPGPVLAERRVAIAMLRDKYPQYDDHALEKLPLIRVTIETVVSWGALSDRGRSPSRSAAGSGSSSLPGDSPRR